MKTTLTFDKTTNASQLSGELKAQGVPVQTVQSAPGSTIVTVSTDDSSVLKAVRAAVDAHTAGPITLGRTRRLVP